MAAPPPAPINPPVSARVPGVRPQAARPRARAITAAMYIFLELNKIFLLVLGQIRGHGAPPISIARIRRRIIAPTWIRCRGCPLIVTTSGWIERIVHLPDWGRLIDRRIRIRCAAPQDNAAEYDWQGAEDRKDVAHSTTPPLQCLTQASSMVTAIALQGFIQRRVWRHIEVDIANRRSKRRQSTRRGAGSGPHGRSHAYYRPC